MHVHSCVIRLSLALQLENGCDLKVAVTVVTEHVADRICPHQPHAREVLQVSNDARRRARVENGDPGQAALQRDPQLLVLGVLFVCSVECLHHCGTPDQSVLDGFAVLVSVKGTACRNSNRITAHAPDDA
eukprot:11555833-Alexandrium_andersonii.AAC.1